MILSLGVALDTPPIPPDNAGTEDPMYWDTGTVFLCGVPNDGGAEYELLRK